MTKSGKKPDMIFKWLKSITFTKKDIMTAENEKLYNPFVVNMWLSANRKTLEFAIMTNKMRLSPRQHYDFMRNAIPKENLYFEYPKLSKNLDNIALVSDYYQCNEIQAMQYLETLSIEDFAMMKAAFDEGGKVKA